jgi:hypothetical protein
MGAPESRNLAPPVRLKGEAPSGLAWKINRLRCMTPAEIGHRVVKAAATQAEAWGFVRCEVPAADLTCHSSPWIHADARANPSPVLDAADRIIAGRYDVFALEDVDLGSPPRWNRDPKTGIEAPLDFGKTLDYRDPSRVGDCKYLWEPNRHPHLVTLAQAYALTSQPRFAVALREQLDSWFIALPVPHGRNWSSSLEAALRLINWSAAWHLWAERIRACSKGRTARRSGSAGWSPCSSTRSSSQGIFRCTRRRTTISSEKSRACTWRASPGRTGRAPGNGARMERRSSSARRCCRTLPTA